MATTFTYPIEIGSTEIDLEVTYSIFGSYRPSSWTHPAEYPELDVESVTYEGTEVPNWMFNLLHEEIKAECWEHKKKEEQDAAADYGAWLYEVRRDALLDARL